MKRSVIVSILALVAAVVPSADMAEVYKNYNFRLDWHCFTLLDEPLPSYDVCWEFTKTVGTLQRR